MAAEIGGKIMVIYCDQCEYENCCSVREVADDLKGCIGHGKLHHKFAEEKGKMQKEAEEKMQKALVLTEERIKELAPGDKVQLIGTTISLGLNLPRYLDNGVFTVIGVTRNGKIKCDWDGGKPFNIPPLYLKKLSID
jgi:hypothetical protein